MEAMRNDASWPRLQPAPSWRARSLAERDRGIVAACHSAMQLLQEVPDRAARLARVDPLPPSTRAHLRRLAVARNG